MHTAINHVTDTCLYLGYWKARVSTAYPDAEIVAFDSHPPGSDQPYHGNSAAAAAVGEGGAEALARYPGYTLFLCCPPPDDPMALECLQEVSREAVRQTARQAVRQ